MLIDTIKAQSNALVLGQITQAQIDAGRASWAQLVADAVLIQPQQGISTAVYIGSDINTKGNWSGVYGSLGKEIIGDSRSFPAYAVISASGKGDYTWAPSPTDSRALKRVTTGRVAACWFGGTFSVDVNLTDGVARKVSLYCLDWDGQRAMRVDVLDAATLAVLDTRTVSAFQGGAYLSWTVEGHVVFKLTSTGGANAVLSGVFLD